MFPDSKHFVDMSCVYSPSQTMADYELFSNCARNDGSLAFLQMFVEVKVYKMSVSRVYFRFLDEVSPAGL